MYHSQDVCNNDVINDEMLLKTISEKKLKQKLSTTSKNRYFHRYIVNNARRFVNRKCTSISQMPTYSSSYRAWFVFNFE